MTIPAILMNEFFNHLLLSAFFLGFTVVTRYLAEHALRKREGMTLETRRRWSVNIRNALILTSLLGLVFIWASEIRTLAVSLVALAAALVLAIKELLLCISGTIFKTSTKAFSVGDIVEIQGIRGYVVDQTLFGTTVMEVVSNLYTGRTVTFPNSHLLNYSLANETYIGKYAVHMLTVPLHRQDDWHMAEKILQEAACAECGSFLEEARRHMQDLASRKGIDTPSVDPKILVTLPDAEHIHLILRFPAPVYYKDRLEQAILHRFLAKFESVCPEPMPLPMLRRAGS